MSRPSKKKALNLLKLSIESMNDVRNNAIRTGRFEDDPVFIRWRTTTMSYIESIFGKNNSNYEEFDMVIYNQDVFDFDNPPKITEERNFFIGKMDKAYGLLRSIVDQVSTQWREDENLNDTKSDRINGGNMRFDSESRKKIKTKEQAEEFIGEIFDKLQTFRRIGHDREFNDWFESVLYAIRKISGPQSPDLHEFRELKFFDDDAIQILSDFSEAELIIDNLLKNIGNWTEEKIKVRKQFEFSQQRKQLSSKIFIVYGHDGDALESAKKLCIELQLEPVLLPERESKGQTIIEKFERLSKECGFALILLTPDDKGKSKSKKILHDRARQNVILELGYFYGSFGRERVLVAYKEGVELPSDMHGIIYSKFHSDVNEIKEDFVRELGSCGIKHKSQILNV